MSTLSCRFTGVLCSQCGAKTASRLNVIPLPATYVLYHGHSWTPTQYVSRTINIATQSLTFADGSILAVVVLRKTVPSSKGNVNVHHWTANVDGLAGSDVANVSILTNMLELSVSSWSYSRTSHISTPPATVITELRGIVSYTCSATRSC